MNVTSSAGGDGGNRSNCSCFKISSSMKFFRGAFAKTTSAIGASYGDVIRRFEMLLEYQTVTAPPPCPRTLIRPLSSTVATASFVDANFDDAVTSRELPSVYLARTTTHC